LGIGQTANDVPVTASLGNGSDGKRICGYAVWHRQNQDKSLCLITEQHVLSGSDTIIGSMNLRIGDDRRHGGGGGGGAVVAPRQSVIQVWGASGFRLSTKEQAENSQVLPPASVAVALTLCPGVRLTLLRVMPIDANPSADLLTKPIFLLTPV